MLNTDLEFQKNFNVWVLILVFRVLIQYFLIIVVSAERFQINDLTAFLDGSNVYGSTETIATLLRTGRNGRLKVSVSS